MLAFTALQLLSCCTLLVCATTILARDPADRGNRHAAILLFSGVVWSICQLLWNTCDDPATALWLVRMSALGWAPIGPLTARFILEVTREPAPRVRAAMPWLFGGSLLVVVADWFTPWIHTGVVRKHWGWGYDFGPTYLIFYVLTVGSLLAGLTVAARAYRRSRLEGERSHARWIAFAIAQLLLIGSTTDALFPFLGWYVPQLATTSYALTGVVLALSLHRFGYSILSPGTFARQISEAMSEGLLLLRLDGTVRSANSGLARILAQPREQLEARAIGEILALPLLYPPRELRDVRGELIAASGARIPVLLTTSLLRDARGEPTGLAVILRDVRDIEALQQRLVLSGRMAAVGQLAAGVAHEVNNPTAYVRSNLLLLRQYWQSVTELLAAREKAHPDDESGMFDDGEELILESIEGVERISAIVTQIGRFSHTGGGERERADLHQLLESVARMAGPRLRERVRLEKSFGSVPRVECAPRELEQVFLNLILNAADAVGEAGTIRLATSMRGGRAQIDVEDDGCGISPEALPRIFDLFFTTKPVGKGTGLGLAISYEIVQRHGGEITVRSEVGRGAVFSVFLPV